MPLAISPEKFVVVGVKVTVIVCGPDAGIVAPVDKRFKGML